MKKNNEIVSLNIVPYELQSELTMDERLEKLTSVELKKLKAGSNVCPKVTTCISMCERDCVANCDMLCEWDGCPYDDPGGWICPCDQGYGEDQCVTMGGRT